MLTLLLIHSGIDAYSAFLLIVHETGSRKVMLSLCVGILCKCVRMELSMWTKKDNILSLHIDL